MARRAILLVLLLFGLNSTAQAGRNVILGDWYWPKGSKNWVQRGTKTTFAPGDFVIIMDDRVVLGFGSNRGDIPYYLNCTPFPCDSNAIPYLTHGAIQVTELVMNRVVGPYAPSSNGQLVSEFEGHAVLIPIPADSYSGSLDATFYYLDPVKRAAGLSIQQSLLEPPVERPGIGSIARDTSNPPQTTQPRLTIQSPPSSVLINSTLTLTALLEGVNFTAGQTTTTYVWTQTPSVGLPAATVVGPSNQSTITYIAPESEGTLTFKVTAKVSNIPDVQSSPVTILVLKQTTEPPTGMACKYSIAPTEESFSSTGGTGTVTVSTDSGCKWTATSNDNWITITSGSNGTGHAAIGYSVAANSSPDRRMGSISLGGQLFKVIQAGLCSFEISPVTQSFTAAGGSGTVTITTVTGCSWTASSNAVFISISSNMSGVASGTITFTVSANSTTETRTGTLTIAGRTFTVTQSGAMPEPEKLYFAQIAKGAGVECEVLLANPSTTAVVSGKIEFLDDNGVPFTAGMADSTAAGIINFSLSPLASLSASTDTSGPAVAGSVRVTSDGRLGGIVRFRVIGVGVASVEEGKPLNGFLVPIRRKGRLNSGIALHNVESTPLVISLSLRDKQGSPVSNGVKTIGVAAGGHFAEFINELFPAANTESFEGILLAQVSGEGKIVAIALELGSAPGEFSTLPVIPLK